MTRQEIMLNEYRNRIEVADNVLSETRAKLTKAEHDRDRYKAEIERLKSQQQEIERLKAENEELTKVVSSKVYDLIDNAKEIADAREAWEQQAKIEVLNELKDKMFEREYMGVKYKERIFYESEIDEMIAEVQNAEDKS